MGLVPLHSANPLGGLTGMGSLGYSVARTTLDREDVAGRFVGCLVTPMTEQFSDYLRRQPLSQRPDDLELYLRGPLEKAPERLVGQY
jgi:hypothetical protein